MSSNTPQQSQQPQQQQKLLPSVRSEGNVAPQKQQLTVQDVGQQMPNPALQSGSELNSHPGNPTQQQQQALEQILAPLKSPAYPQQQQQVLSILKSNPALVAAFIKQRTAQQQNDFVGQQNPDRNKQQELTLQDKLNKYFDNLEI